MLSRLTLTRSQAQIRHVEPIMPAAAAAPVAAVYAQVQRDFGMLAPPISLHAASPETLAASWLMLRETLVATGLAARASKEAVAATVSVGNTCPYCVEIHATMLHGLIGSRAAQAIAADRAESVADPATREIVAWARSSGTREAAEHARPFPIEQTPEFAGVAVTFQYLNRMVNVFLGDPPIPPDAPASVRRVVMRLLGRVLAPLARRHVEPGASLGLLPAADLPDDLFWAGGNPYIAEAFARAAAAVDEAGRRSVPESVRDLVIGELASWNGHPPGLSRAWADDALGSLTKSDRPAGRLALLTALASYQVRQSDIDAFRRAGADDRALVELTSWASLTAARRTGEWPAKVGAVAGAEGGARPSGVAGRSHGGVNSNRSR